MSGSHLFKLKSGRVIEMKEMTRQESRQVYKICKSHITPDIVGATLQKDTEVALSITQFEKREDIFDTYEVKLSSGKIFHVSVLSHGDVLNQQIHQRKNISKDDLEIKEKLLELRMMTSIVKWFDEDGKEMDKPNPTLKSCEEFFNQLSLKEYEELRIKYMIINEYSDTGDIESLDDIDNEVPDDFDIDLLKPHVEKTTTNSILLFWRHFNQQEYEEICQYFIYLNNTNIAMSENDLMRIKSELGKIEN